MARTIRLIAFFTVLILTTLARLHAWAGPYDPLDPFGKPDKPVKLQAPKPPKPFKEKDGIRYYALSEFEQDETNIKKIFKDKDDRGKVLALGDASFDWGFCFNQKKGVENFLQWHLDGKFAQLETVVGIPDDFKGDVTIFVYGDDRRIYKTEALTSAHRQEKIAVPVDGVEHLSIRTHATQKAVGARIVVGDPFLTREPGM